MLIDNTHHRYLHGLGWCRYECGGGFTSLSGLAIEAWERMTYSGVGYHSHPWSDVVCYANVLGQRLHYYAGYRTVSIASS